jgi:TP901 family phage tail tape measure protein
MAQDLQASIRISLLDQFSAPLRGMATSLERFKGHLSGFSFPNVARFAADLNQAGEGMMRFGSGIANALKAGVHEFAEFEKRASKMKAIGGLTAAEFKRSKELAEQLGETTAFSGSQAYDVEINYATLGKKMSEIEFLLPVTLDIATAEDAAPEMISEKFGKVMQALKKEASQAGEVADVLVGASTFTSANFDTLYEFIADAGSIGGVLKQDLPTIAAFGAALNEAGVAPRSAGEAFRNLSLRLASLPKPTREAMAAIGMGNAEIKELQGLIDDNRMPEALRKIGTALEGLSPTKKLDILGDLADQAGAVPMLKMIEASMSPESEKSIQSMREKFRELEAAARGGDSLVRRIAATMADNLSGELERTDGALTGLQKRIGDILEHDLRELLKGIQGVAGAIGAWTKENPELTAGLVKITAAVAGLSIAGGGALFTLSALTTSFGVMVKGLSFGLSALSGLGTAFGWIGELGPLLLNLGRTAGTAWSVFGGLSGILTGIGGAITAIGAALTGPVAIIAGLVAAVGLGAYYTLKWAGQLDNVTTWFAERFSAEMGAMGAVLEFLVGAFVREWRAMTEFASEAWGYIVGFAEVAAGAIVRAWNETREFFGELWDELATAAGMFGGFIGDLLGPTVVGFIKDAWEPIADFFSGLWNGIADAFNSTLGPLFGKVSGFIEETRSIGRGKLGSIFGDDDEEKSHAQDGYLFGPKPRRMSRRDGIEGTDEEEDDDSSIFSIEGLLKKFRKPKQKKDDAAKQVPLFDFSANMSLAPEKKDPATSFVEDAQRTVRDAIEKMRPAAKAARTAMRAPHARSRRRDDSEADEPEDEQDDSAVRPSSFDDNAPLAMPMPWRARAEREDSLLQGILPANPYLDDDGDQALGIPRNPFLDDDQARDEPSRVVALPRMPRVRMAPPVIATRDDDDSDAATPTTRLAPVTPRSEETELLRGMLRKLDEILSEAKDNSIEESTARRELLRAIEGLQQPLFEVRELLHRGLRESARVRGSWGGVLGIP